MWVQAMEDLESQAEEFEVSVIDMLSTSIPLTDLRGHKNMDQGVDIRGGKKA